MHYRQTIYILLPHSAVAKLPPPNLGRPPSSLLLVSEWSIAGGAMGISMLTMRMSTTSRLGLMARPSPAPSTPWPVDGALVWWLWEWWWVWVW